MIPHALADSAPVAVVVTADELEAWADQHHIGVSEVSPGHYYAVRANLVTGTVEVRMAYGRAA